MDNKQLAKTYAVAKCLGYEKSIECFVNEYSQYFKDAISYLKENSEPNIAMPVKHPFRT